MGSTGADQLTGGAGTDILQGGRGADTFIFAAGSKRDVIDAFNVGQGDKISLQINLNGSGITDGASALARVSDISGNAVLNLGDGNTVILTGVLTADLDVGSFLFF
ncbi:MAG: hypothetical protein V4772_06415 [Pseudomonadota bacterium]